jgi:hypothetical protein
MLSNLRKRQVSYQTKARDCQQRKLQKNELEKLIAVDYESYFESEDSDYKEDLYSKMPTPSTTLSFPHLRVATRSSCAP